MKNEKTLSSMFAITLISTSLLTLSACSSRETQSDSVDGLSRGYNNGMNLNENHGDIQSGYPVETLKEAPPLPQATSRLTSNSAYNAIDTSVTAQDQGTSEYDMQTTRTIRKKIVAQDDFSSNAKNVKIITINGTVVLKGPVETMAEKSTIESIATNIAGSAKVVSEITVVK